LRTETVFARAPLGAVSLEEPPDKARCMRAALDQIDESLTTQSRCLFVVNATAATLLVLGPRLGPLRVGLEHLPLLGPAYGGAVAST